MCVYICISVPFVCEVDLENKYSILYNIYDEYSTWGQSRAINGKYDQIMVIKVE